MVGVDVGGTKVAAGLVNQSGTILYQTRIPMVSDSGAANALAAVRAAIDSVAAQARLQPRSQGSVRAIGICSPGPLNPYTGTVVNPPNLPCWRNYPLAREISQIYGVKVKVDNDANAAALAEALWGAGRGCRNVFCATIGTGIGTGVVMDGHIYHGRTGAAAEGGHLTIDYRGPRCRCGKPGCIEIFASGPAIAKRARSKLASTPDVGPVLLKLCSGNLDRVTGEMIGKAYAAGDLLAKQILEEIAELLTFWLGNIVDMLEPDIMIIGGGAATLMQPFFHHIQERLPGCCVNSRCQEIPLVMARFGEDAGIVGGAALCAGSVGLTV
ncbi:MAG: ROK family protein [Terriglobales bacterium]